MQQWVAVMSAHKGTQGQEQILGRRLRFYSSMLCVQCPGDTHMKACDMDCGHLGLTLGGENVSWRRVWGMLAVTND